MLYWMQQAQRLEYNHALEYAIEQANELNQSVLVGFGLMDNYPEANARHYTFMLEGLRETQTGLARRGIKMVIKLGSPEDICLSLGQDASLIVCDCGYLRHQKAWRSRVARLAVCPVIQVESDVVIPVEVVSGKNEYAARTIRPKILRHLNDYLIPLKTSRVKKTSMDKKIKGLNLTCVGNVIKKLSIDQSVKPVSQFFKGGTSQGKEMFDAFVNTRLRKYIDNRNQPHTDDISHMSPYLHFGHISPLYLALKIQRINARYKKQREAYLEELIVRRELAMNFVNFSSSYDAYKCLPEWARKSLGNHKKDPREYTYTHRQLESATTHDKYWNAAMREMKITGFMHNYMRMYWGKKILEWSKTPEHAFRTAMALNNKYFLDGRDANSYAGVAWIFGMHDRAWFERPVFGKIRYMAASGLERKCDIKEYVKKVEILENRSNSI